MGHRHGVFDEFIENSLKSLPCLWIVTGEDCCNKWKILPLRNLKNE